MRYWILIITVLFLPLEVARSLTVLPIQTKKLILKGFDQESVFLETPHGRKLRFKRSEFPDVSKMKVGRKIMVDVNSPIWARIPPE